MCKYSSKNDYPNIILHDCKITKISKENNDLIFEFNDKGFWIGKDNKHNPYNKILRTGKSMIRFVEYEQEFTDNYIFKEYRLMGKTILTKRLEVSFDYIISQINAGKWQFEFIDEFYGWRKAEFDGYIWLNKKPYCMEAQLQLNFKEMLYFWDEIYEDRTW